MVITDEKTKAQRGEVTKSRSGARTQSEQCELGPTDFFLPEHPVALSNPVSRVKSSLCTWLGTHVHAPVGVGEQHSRGPKCPSGPRAGGGAAAPQSKGAIIIAIILIHLFNILLVSPFYGQED